jgi:hypothetical protein
MDDSKQKPIILHPQCPQCLGDSFSLGAELRSAQDILDVLASLPGWTMDPATTPTETMTEMGNRA